jgi:hypothetical protein
LSTTQFDEFEVAMTGPTARRAAILLLLILCAFLHAPLVAQANRRKPAEPPTMQGFLRYQIRGLTAASGAFAGGAIKGQAMYVAAVHRMLPGFFKILSGMAKFSKDPTTQEMSDFLRSQGPNVNFSALPVSAGYGAELEFTLEQVRKDEWQLKRGNVRWSSETYFRLAAGEGELMDKFRGQGSAALDPKTSAITLVMTGKKGSRRASLDVSAQFPAAIDGMSLFRTPIATITIELRGNKEIWQTQSAFGFSNREVKESSPPMGGVYFGKEGPPQDVFRGWEIYQDLLDSGVMAEWELWPKCGAWIEEPSDNAELVYDDKKPGQLVDTALAQVQPSFWGGDLQWLLPQISESELDPPRDKATGDSFEVKYTNLPEKNSEFRKTKVLAYFDSDRAKQAGCEDPEPVDVGYFFSRSALNHGGLPGLKAGDNSDNRPNPNWLHYWMQTKANVGLPWHFVRYGAMAGTCQEALGYYPPGEKHVVVCDPRDFTKWNPFRADVLEGIDFFAALLLHEKQHHDDYWRWWAAGHDIELDSDPVNPETNWRGKAGLPGDWIPDLLEHTVPVPRQIKARKGARFSPNRQDSFGYKLDDEHYLAYAAEFQWRMGSADQEDWSCPGKQTFECGQ